MAKSKTPSKARNEAAILQSLEYLESMRILQADRDEVTQLISLRVPKNLLKTLKTKAKLENRKYQSMIVNFIREGLKKDVSKS